MSTTAISAPPWQPSGSAPCPRKWTVVEFNHMGDMGWFEGRRAYLLDGVIWEDGPMNLPHSIALGLVSRKLDKVFGPTWWVRGQQPLHVDQQNDPMPDVAVVPGDPRDYSGGEPTTAALVVEVADTSLSSDITEKAERYATAGVADYWVLDLNGRRLLVLRDPAPLPAGLGATAYRAQLTLGPTDHVSPLAMPTATILVADLLP